MSKIRVAKTLFPVVIGIALAAVLLTGLGWQSGRAAPEEPQAAARYVAPSGTDTGTCGNEADPCATIQFAVDVANPGDEIRIATFDVVLGFPLITTTAEYTGTGANVIEVTKDITLTGGYVYTHRDFPSFHRWEARSVPAWVNGEDTRRGLLVNGNITATVRFLAFKYGRADYGGNIYAEDAHLKLVGTPILSGTAVNAGGGVYLKNCGGSLEIGNTQWSDLLDISGLLPVLGNSADYGGGLYVDGGDPILTGLLIRGNRAAYDGGGIYFLGDNAAIALGLIRSNWAGSNGGGLYLDESAAKIAGMQVFSNTATNGAGFYLKGPFTFNPLELPLIANAYVRHNTASANGGGMYFRESIAGLLNNVVADNRAADGAGMYLWASSPRVYHNTLAQNTGSNGIYVTHKPGQAWPPVMPMPSYPAFTNTMVVSHSVGVYVDSTGLPAPLQNKVRLDGTLWWGNGSNDAGPGLIASSHNVFGNPMFTCTDDPPDCINPYHILTDSLALDAGVDITLFSDYSLRDIDLQPRPSGLGYDIGVDEIISETYDVQILPHVSITRTDPGTTVTHTHIILNSGTETDTYGIAIGSPTGWSVLASPASVTLSPGGIDTVTVRVTVPANAVNRDYDRTVITATSQTDLFSRAYAVDVTTVYTGEVSGVVDLQIRKIAGQDTAYGGEGIRYTLTLTREGTITQSQTITLTDQVNPPSALDAWAFPNNCTGNNATGDITCTMTLPPFSGVETHTLSIVLTTTEVYTGWLMNNVEVQGNNAPDPESDNDTDYALVGIRSVTAIEHKIYLPLILR